MNPDMVLPIVTSAARLIVACVGLASYRLGWARMLKMGIIWVLIFGGVYVLAEWFLLAQGTASGLM